jgi:hypothetical protein
VAVNRIRKTLVLVAVVAVPAAAHSTFAPAPNLCIASGTATYRLAPTASAPDFRVRIESAAHYPDLRIQLVDSPALADFVIADDFSAASESTACQTATPAKTVKVDAEAQKPDVVVNLAADIADPDYRVYVHSMRHSSQDAAALLAVMWKTQHSRTVAARD